MKTVLSIAGFDPSSGAGITADLMVFAAHRLYGTSCITGLTIQSTLGVRRVQPVACQIVAETLECLHHDMPPAGIKIGMLSTSDNVRAVEHYLQSSVRNNLAGESVPVVLDPVIESSSGTRLLDDFGLVALQAKLLAIVDWITPNAAELHLLSGERVDGAESVPAACAALQERLATPGHRVGIFAKGGHLNRPDDLLLTPSGESIWLPGERVDTTSTHGTGCALASAFLSGLVLGYPPHTAAISAKKYVSQALRTAVTIGAGNGPLNHLWPLVKEDH